jgi:hypothetical protein
MGSGFLSVFSISGADQRRRAVAAQVAGDLTTAGGVPNHDSVLKIESFKQSSQIVGVGIRLVAVPRLAGTAVTPPVMSDHSIAMLAEAQHLRVPIVRS